MKLITKPSIYLVSKPDVDRAEITRFLEEHGFAPRFANDHELPAEQLSAVASRTCYQSFDNGRKPDDHLKHLVAVGHGSVFTHANFSLLCTGISRSLTHELIRHHVGTGVSQLSQRFVDDPDEINFVVPPALIQSSFIKSEEMEARGYRPCVYKELYTKQCKEDIERYTYWLSVYKEWGYNKKEAASAARAKLTNDVETRCVFTGNIRAWRNIWEQRCTPEADAEIRRFACATLRRIAPHCDTILSDYDATPLPDGSFTLSTLHRKI